MDTLSGRRRRLCKLWVPLVFLTALAGALRLVGLGRVPPGLYHDEAFNGLDALRVLAGDLPLFFAGNHGREPFFLYVMAAAVGALGRTPIAVRMPAALCGTLTIPATYAMTRSWFSRHTALLSASILSITVWHIQLSRVGFRAVTLPLATACFIAWLGRAFRLRTPLSWLFSGMLYGFLFYTYVAARFTPVALFLFAVCLLAQGHAHQLWPGALHFALGAVVALMPLGIFAVNHWDTVMGRPAQVSILNPAIHGGDVWGTLARHCVNTLGMFFARGDTIPRHNVPGRPVFNLLVGVALLLGVARAAFRARRGDAGSALILIWVAAMLVPTIAAADAPHFLRAAGVLPPLAVLPALGLEGIWRAAVQRDRGAWVALLLCLVLAFTLGDTIRDYFFRYGSSSDAAYAFESAATELATQVNRFTGVGWNGDGARASSAPVSSERRVYLDRRLWEAWESLRFLVPDQQAVALFHPDTAVSPAPADEWLFFLWPYDDLQHQLATLLPHPARIAASGGPLTRGDLEDKPYPAYASYRVEPLQQPTPAPLARFGESIELVDFEIAAHGPAQTVRLFWRARKAPDAAYTVFVYLCPDPCNGDRVLAQDDAQPGEGYYPTHFWQPGDVVVDIHELEPPTTSPSATSVSVGLYRWPTMERLPVTGPSGKPLGTEYVLPGLE